MFNPTLRTSPSRVCSLWLAALVGLLGTGAAAATAQASTTAPPAAGGAVIASVSDTTIETTSGSGEAAGHAASKPSSGTLTLNSGGGPAVTRTPTTRTSSATQIGDSDLASPEIVASASRHSASPSARGTLSQIQSDGPIVASSGTPAVAAKHTSRAYTHRSSVGTRSSRVYVPPTPPAASSSIGINAPGVHFLINTTSARRPASGSPRPSAPAGPTAGQVGSPGAGFPGLLSTVPHRAPAPGGPANTTLYGSGSGSTGGSALLGIDGLFTLAVLLVGAVWRRRPWDLPVLPRQSALLSLALDRPG